MYKKLLQFSSIRLENGYAPLGRWENATNILELGRKKIEIIVSKLQRYAKIIFSFLYQDRNVTISLQIIIISNQVHQNQLRWYNDRPFSILKSISLKHVMIIDV